MDLDLLPPDLAGQVKALQEYEFTSSEAREKFEELLDQLREQLMQRFVDQVSGSMQSMSPEDMARMKDMLAELNTMLEQRAEGEEPDFDGFMERYGDFFPENPQSLDELLELMAQRMAAMQAMLNSMTPEQRAQLQSLSDQLLEDMDLRWQVDQLGQNLQAAFPDMNWNRRYDFSGQDPMGFGEAASVMEQLGDLDQLENLLRNATSPGALAEVDLDKVKEHLGEDSAESLEKLAELAKLLQDAGLIENKEGRFELTAKGMRRIGQNALAELFKRLSVDKMGGHQVERVGIGHERAYDTKPYEFGDPFNLHIERTVRNAVSRQGPGTPVRLRPDDFEVERTEHLVRSSTVLMLDLSLSMPMRDNFLPAKKVAMALHSLISSRFPRDFLGIVGFSERRPGPDARPAPRGLLGLRVRHQHAARLPAQPSHAGPPVGHQADHHDHRRRADRPQPPQRRGVLQLPAGAGDGRGHAARGGPVHQGGHPHQHLHARPQRAPEGVRGAPDPSSTRGGPSSPPPRPSATTSWSTSSSRSGPWSGADGRSSLRLSPVGPRRPG